MKRILAALLAFGLIGGLALADDFDIAYPEDFEEGEAWTASVTQDITVHIPPRAALHITEPEWTLDLDVDASINEYCYFVAKNVMGSVPEVWWAQEYLATLPKATGYGYPAINPDATNITDADKGYLICVFEKVVQKFANMDDGWTIEVRLNNAGTSVPNFGVFGISDAFNGELLTASTTEADGELLLSNYSAGTTGGWLDDNITEAFFFDGTEWYGTHLLELTFDLVLP